jgi:type I restriction enzyme S subunit
MSRKTKNTATQEDAKVAGASSSMARQKGEQDAPSTLVPKLRFPGFDKPWSNDPLSKTLKEHKIKNTAGRDVFSVSMEYGIVNQIELLGRSFAAADTSHYTVGRRFDVVYTKSPLKAFPFGVVKQCKFDGEVALSPLYGVFTPPNPHVGLMIEAYFEAPNRSKDFLAPLCQKGAKNTLQITNTTFLSGRLPLPTQPAEQQKIAECLSSVDELIASQARKLDALKTHKKGLMQQLFPREGETQPRLRFPEFQNEGEWEVKSFADLCSVKHGYPFESEFFSNEGEYALLTPGSFYEEGGYRDRGDKQKYYSGEIPSDYVLAEGAMLVAMTEQAAGLLGSPLIVPASNKFLHNQRLGLIARKPGVAWSSEFFFHVFNTQRVRKAIHDTASGAKVRHTSPTKIGDVLVSVPSTLPEQQRIASCLTSLDDLIAAQTQKHEALKTHKQGLMQQLFPSPEEVAA